MVASSILLIALLPLGASTQSHAPPFAELDRRASQTRGGWAGTNHEEFSAIFDSERKRLGDRFEPDLLKYLGTSEFDPVVTGPNDLSAPFTIGDEGLSDLSVVLDYNNAIIRGKVEFVGKGPALGMQIGVVFAWPAETAARRFSRSVLKDGTFYLDAAKPEDYRVSIVDLSSRRSEKSSPKKPLDSKRTPSPTFHLLSILTISSSASRQNGSWAGGRA